MPIAKVQEKFRFFHLSFYIIISMMKRNVCWLSSKQLTVEWLTPNVWSLKTCEKVGFLSNSLSWNVLTFRALSLRQITAALFVYSGVVSRHNKSMKIDFPLTLMVYHRKLVHLSKNKMLWQIGHISKTRSQSARTEKCYFKFCLNRWSKTSKILNNWEYS